MLYLIHVTSMIVLKENNMNFEELLKKHTDEDHKNFEKIEKRLDLIIDGQKKTHAFMDTLGWLSDISKATDLLKKPSLWVLAFVLGMVALFGGVKALVGAIISIFITKQ